MEDPGIDPSSDDEGRISPGRQFAYAVIAVAMVLPRLVALLHERTAITPGYTLGEKSDDIARTWIDSGTFGFIPGHPSAYTQPLYSWFLIPLYEALGRSWVVVGGAQIVVATVTACIVFEIGRRWLSASVGLGAALITALHPYSIWHDVHINREILDGLLAAALFLVVMALSARRSLWLAAVLGAIMGVAILGNVRLTALPFILAVFLAVVWRPAWRAAAGAIAVILIVCTVVLVPWVVRNKVEVGCATLTTDARALWEANNEATLGVLRNGRWIDNIPLPATFPPSAQDAGREYRRHGKTIAVDECGQATFYRGKVLTFWREHPSEKAKLAAQATLMLWNPIVSPSDTDPDARTSLNKLRESVEPIFTAPIFILALLGLFVVPRRFAGLCLTLLGYQWVMAAVFVGATRYRVPWDFIPALLAAAAVAEIVARIRSRRQVGSQVRPATAR